MYTTSHSKMFRKGLGRILIYHDPTVPFNRMGEQQSIDSHLCVHKSIVDCRSSLDCDHEKIHMQSKHMHTGPQQSMTRSCFIGLCVSMLSLACLQWSCGCGCFPAWLLENTE
jgi:hypothetical protein